MAIKEMGGKEWEDWFHHSKTQDFLEMLKSSVAGDMWTWLNGGFANSSDPVAAAVSDAFARGGNVLTQQIIDAIEGIVKNDDGEEGNQQRLGNDPGGGPDSGQAT